MPSPTESTVPTSATSASVPKDAICCFRIEEISAARISILRNPLHRDLQAMELGLERSVDHARADLDDDAAEKARIDAHVDRDLGADGGAKLLIEPRTLPLVERLRGNDIRRHLAAALRELGEIRLDHVGDGEEAAVLCNEAEKILREAPQPRRFGERADRLLLLVAREHRAAHQ